MQLLPSQRVSDTCPTSSCSLPSLLQTHPSHCPLLFSLPSHFPLPFPSHSLLFPLPLSLSPSPSPPLTLTLTHSSASLYHVFHSVSFTLNPHTLPHSLPCREGSVWWQVSCCLESYRSCWASCVI